MEILENISLKSDNTFGIDVIAKYYYTIDSAEAFIALSQTEIFQNNKYLLLGGGSNVLFTSDYDGLIIKNNLKGISIVEENNDHIILNVGSGENWHEFVLYCIKNDWGGIENMSLIPGTVGAAPIQNIGAYGIEIKDILISVETIEIDSSRAFTFKNKDCLFDYRSSIFKGLYKGKHFITNVQLKLTKQNHLISTQYGDIQGVLSERNISQPTIKNVSDAVISIRQSKLPDPKIIGNAGSFFKNPIINQSQFEVFIASHPEAPSYKVGDHKVKVPAGWLIEQCGWKGKVIGNTGSHAKQALVLVNHGNAEGNEVKTLAHKIIASVKTKFGIDIEPEVNII